MSTPAQGPQVAAVPPSGPKPRSKVKVLWKTSLAATALVLCFGIWECASTMKMAGKQADIAAASFHSDLNAERYSKIYGEASSRFRQSSSQEDISKFFAAVHRKLGAAQSSQSESYFATATTGGKFVRVVYATKFDNGKATETFEWQVDGDRLLLVGYHIESMKLVNE